MVDVTGTWVGGPSLKSYEETIFALSTFSRRSRDLIRSKNADTMCFK